MKRSIFFKIFGSYFLIISIFSVLVLFLSFQPIRNHYINTLTKDLRNLAYSLSLKILPLVEQRKYQELDALVKETGKNIKTRITVIAPDGKVLADSEKDPALMENHRNRPEIVKAMKKGFGSSLRFSTTVKEEMLYVAIPLKSEGKLIGVLRVSLFLREINTLLNSLRMKILCIIIFLTLLSLIGAYIFSRNLSRPIKELVYASKKLAGGDFNTKVIMSRKDELGELARSFNEMSEQLKKLFNTLTFKQEELNGIISSLVEGLVVLDKKGRISLFNESFKKIVQVDELEGKLYWEVLRSAKIIELVERALKDKRNFLEEVELNEKIFLCSVACTPSEEVIIVLHNITEFKKLEKIKKDFVVNVSHELRTPLTAIKGYVETLEEEVQGDAKHYLNIIKRHTERIINIVQDLLTLAELEERGLSEDLEKVELKAMVEDVFKMFRQKADEKNLKLNLRAEGNTIIKGDPFKLEQMFINLIDNAIKYTEKGEITVTLKGDDTQVHIEVKDTGIGIPSQHLDRIFERFYVVDKSRSKKLGGTGLGLSIVKHIVLLHKGEIKVESTPGKGTKFTITLPVNPYPPS